MTAVYIGFSGSGGSEGYDKPFYVGPNLEELLRKYPGYSGVVQRWEDEKCVEEFRL